MATQDYRTVVVGTDGTALAVPAVTRAARIADRADAGLVIVCAWTEPRAQAKALFTESAAVEGSQGGKAVGRKAAKGALKDAVKLARAKGASVRAALLVNSEATEAILQVAEAYEADLIVLGVTPRPSLAERLLGTVAADVSKRAHCDVLLVSTQPSDEPDTGPVEVDIPDLVTEAITLPR